MFKPAMDSVLVQRASPVSNLHDPSDGVRRIPLKFQARLRFGLQSPLRPISSKSTNRRPVFIRSQEGNGLATHTDSAEHTILTETGLKNKGKDVAKDLKGTCIFLVGMMGSGKSTVGKILSKALGYYFFDSDKLVEQAAGGVSVAQIFAQGNEEGFRDSESEVLHQLSGMFRLVVATGGGAVVRPRNWSYFRHGLTVYLDVPLEALAKRVVAAGIEKRPLLGQHVAHEQALACLTKLYEKRGKAYEVADITVSIQSIAKARGIHNLDELTPSMIAFEVLEQTHELLQSQRHYGNRKAMIL